MFLNEIDLLDIRINELNTIVDKFVIVEFNYSMSGIKKDFIFLKNKDRFKKFESKIDYHPIEIDFSKFNTLNYDDRHFYADMQRDILKQKIDNLKLQDDDVFIFSDLDEIPRCSKVEEIIKHPDTLNQNNFITLLLRGHYWFLNCAFTSPVNHVWFPVAIMGKYKNLKNTNFSGLRNQKEKFLRIAEAGWHFSHCGNPEFLQEKMLSSSHSEYHNPYYTSIENITNRRNKFLDPYDRGYGLERKELNEYYPKYILENKHKFFEIIA